MASSNPTCRVVAMLTAIAFAVAPARSAAADGISSPPGIAALVAGGLGLLIGVPTCAANRTAVKVD